MKFTNKKIHIGIIVLGIIFLLIPVFHTGLWFDESYTVGIVNKGFGDIWSIGKNDVHPIFYYWILHAFNLIFGSNILVYRIISVLFMAILGILGYTHIRKDFGEKAGILFSIFVFFFPVNVVYAGEIRMYSLAMLLVTLMSIYAYRIYKNKNEKNKVNWLLFAIFSLASAYTHYYGLMIAFLENLILFLLFIIQSVKEKKITYNFKAFFVSAIPQILLYIPWLITLLQKVSTTGDFWIALKFPDTVIELLTFPFTGNLGGSYYVILPMAIIYALSMYGYLIFIHIKNRKDESLRPALFSIILWMLLLLTSKITSDVIGKVVIYARYMLVAGGLFSFFISYTMSKKGNRDINIIAITTTIVLSMMVVCGLAYENYDKSNVEYKEYVKTEIKKDDLFICTSELTGVVTSTYLPNNEIYFWDKDNWGIEEAYKAFGKTIYDFEFLKDYSGRIWVSNPEILNAIKEKYEVKEIDNKEFYTRYKGQHFNLILIEK